MKRTLVAAIAWSAGSALSLGTAATSSAALVHRYSFNDNGGSTGLVATDSVGGANGTLSPGNTAGNASIANGFLNTNVVDNPPTNGNYNSVTLPNGVASGITGDFTIEDFSVLTTNTRCGSG